MQRDDRSQQGLAASEAAADTTTPPAGDPETIVVDARGSYCPGPLMELIKTIKAQPVGATVDLLSGDRGSSKDVPEWVAKAGHELVGVFEEEGHWRIRVRKGR
nr:sulfurtransferase TusA family protein [Limnochorda pilosa]